MGVINIPNIEFTQIRSLVKYCDDQANRNDEYAGGVLLHGFDLDGEIKTLQDARWTSPDIIDYIIYSNPVLWAQCWLRNPMEPSKPLTLFTHQKAILNCQHKYKLTRCGRQVGKTLCIAVDMIYTAMCMPYAKLLYVAPYLSHVKILFEQTLLPIIADTPDVKNSIIKMPSHPYYQAIFKNGSEISAMTAGTKSGQKGAGIRGKSADKLYLDEVDYMGSDSIAAARATMFARPDSKLWVSSTPSGKREEFYHWAVDSDSDFICKECRKLALDGSPFHYPSHISPLFTDEADRAYKKQFPQLQYDHEVLAEWGEELEGVFRHADIDIALSMGRREIVNNNGETEIISYSYNEMRPDKKCIYILGIDWNKETTGVQFCIIEYNPTGEVINSLPQHMYRVFRTEIITSKEFSETGAINRVFQLCNEIPIAFVYADEGYGVVQIEALKRVAVNSNKRDLANRIFGINLASAQDIYDPLTRQRVSKPMKPFMVDNAMRVVESHRIVLPDCEDEKTKLVGQMREYLVIRRGLSGQPVYSPLNEDMLTAFMMALLGYCIQYSDLINVDSVNTVLRSLVSPSTIISDAIEPRWGAYHSPGNTLHDIYGVGIRGHKMEETVRAAGYQYEYTTDKRPEEMRPYTKPLYSGESIRGTRSSGRAARSTKAPSRAKF